MSPVSPGFPSAAPWSAWKWKVLLSLVQPFATPWIAAHQDPLSMGLPKQGYWSGLLFSSPRGSSWPRDWTQVSCLAGRFFTVWAIVQIWPAFRKNIVSPTVKKFNSHSTSHCCHSSTFPLHWDYTERIVSVHCFPSSHILNNYKELDHIEVWALRNWFFGLLCWRLLRVSWTARRSNQPILKEINPEYSLEGLMWKLQHFGHLM